MSYKDTALCRVRTVTTFLSLHTDRNNWKQSIVNAANLCRSISDSFLSASYTVQSIRIVTNPFGDYLNTESIETAKADLQFINDILKAPDMPKIRIRFAIGEARTAHELSLLPEMIQEFGDLCNACVNIDTDDAGIMDNTMIQHAARAIDHIGRITPHGAGNFNFTVNFNCQPLIPYFPASYCNSDTQPSFVVGLETPDLMVNVLNQLEPIAQHNEFYQIAYEKLHTALQYHIDKVVAIARQYDGNSSFRFAGIDSSAAPSKDCSSLVDVYRLLGVDYFGASGTVEASSLLTRVFKSINNVELVGFSGLMLAVTEDQGLAQGTKKNEFDIRTLLTNSAVCGIGLDTVPIPGDTPIEKICALMRDTGTMAYRLNKPLTVRLFPVPGAKAGDMTTFDSDDLCNCAVMAVL